MKSIPGNQAHRASVNSAFAGALGLFVALLLLKFGNPVILDYKLTPPSDLIELISWSWPVNWAYPWLVILIGWGAILRLRMGFAKTSPGTERHPAPPIRWLAWLPLLWLFWQALSAIWTVRWELTYPTLKHFIAVTACFYLGWFVVSRLDDLRPFWLGVLGGFVGVVAIGLEQHFGGLEATRRWIYSQPDWQNQSPALLQKLASNRIYSTLFYPNTLAGVILLLLPALLGVTLHVTTRPHLSREAHPGKAGSPDQPGDAHPQLALEPVNGRVARVLWASLGAIAALGGLFCLYWSGSKAGWLIAMVLFLIGLHHIPSPTKLRWVAIMCLILIGSGLFFARFHGYFAKGATSVGARFDYWNVAVQIASQRPWFGSGPGTFSVLYRYLKPPEAEMARLVHNDYLEQAADSGIPAALLYTTFWIGGLYRICPFRRFTHSGWMERGVWFGLLGMALQSLVEFGLYVPAMAWPGFLLLGTILGHQANRMDTPSHTR